MLDCTTDDRVGRKEREPGFWLEISQLDGWMVGWNGMEWLTITKLRERYISRIRTFGIIRLRSNRLHHRRIGQIIDIRLWWKGSRARLADIVVIDIWVIDAKSVIDGVACLVCVKALRCFFCGGVAGQESGKTGGGVVRQVGVGDGAVD